MISHGNRKVIRNVLIVALIAGGVVLYNKWQEYPYCTIEHQDINTIKGVKPMWRYALSKLITQRRELQGQDSYAMYLYARDADGLASIRFSVDGVTYPIEFVPNTTVFEKEIEGDIRFGLHKYCLDVVDGKGNKSHSESYIKVSPIAGVVI